MLQPRCTLAAQNPGVFSSISAHQANMSTLTFPTNKSPTLGGCQRAEMLAVDNLDPERLGWLARWLVCERLPGRVWSLLSWPFNTLRHEMYNIYIYIYVHTYTYAGIERERERDSETAPGLTQKSSHSSSQPASASQLRPAKVIMTGSQGVSQPKPRLHFHSHLMESFNMHKLCLIYLIQCVQSTSEASRPTERGSSYQAQEC